jgi:lipopolysaccharide export system permease protein
MPILRSQRSLSLPALNLLDRYILRSALFTCLAAVAVFAFVLMTGNIVRDLIGPGLSGQISPAAFGRLVLLLIPFVLSYALPMGMLTGVLLALGRLSADSEITAMRACGISLVRIARPVLLMGFLGAAVGLPINFESMPWARVQYDRELTAAVRANPLNFIVPRTFIRDFPGFVAYIGQKKGNELKDIWLWELDAGKRVTRFVRAAAGHLEYTEPTNEFILTLDQAQVETRNEKDPENFAEAEPVGTFEKLEPMRLPLDQLFGRTGPRQKLRWMTYAQLEHERFRLKAEKVPPAQAQAHERDRMRVAITIQEKITSALAILSFAFIAVPLGIKVSRRETSANLAVAVAFALSYYFLTVMLSWLDPYPQYRPDILIWFPNVFLFGIGAWLFRRIGR